METFAKIVNAVVRSLGLLAMAVLFTALIWGILGGIADATGMLSYHWSNVANAIVSNNDTLEAQITGLSVLLAIWLTSVIARSGKDA